MILEPSLIGFIKKLNDRIFIDTEIDFIIIAKFSKKDFNKYFGLKRTYFKGVARRKHGACT